VRHVADQAYGDDAMGALNVMTDPTGAISPKSGVTNTAAPTGMLGSMLPDVITMTWLDRIAASPTMPPTTNPAHAAIARSVPDAT
jgi:hypothetical protein